MTDKSRMLFVVIVVACSVTMALAQAKSTGPKYDPAKEVTVKGTVQEVHQIAQGDVTELAVKSGDKTVQVYLAPAEFLKEIDCWIKAGDQVEIVGAKSPESDEILARAVTFGNNTMTLRDSKGVPIWSTWKPANPSGR